MLPPAGAFVTSDAAHAESIAREALRWQLAAGGGRGRGGRAWLGIVHHEAGANRPGM